MKKFIYGFMISIICLALFFPGISKGQDAKKQHIAVHLKSFTNDLHAAAMALKLAKGLEDKGVKTTLVLTLEGVRLADKKQNLDLRWGSTPTMKELLKAYLKSGGEIIVCPHCAKAAGISKKSLRKGAVIGEGKVTIPDILIKADKVLDY